MPQRTAARLRELMEELNRAQSASGDTAERARKDLADLMRRNELGPAGTSGASSRRPKAGRKKR